MGIGKRVQIGLDIIGFQLANRNAGNVLPIGGGANVSEMAFTPLAVIAKINPCNVRVAIISLAKGGDEGIHFRKKNRVG